ncbi:hypothetical protein ACIHFD_46025 [Nonomuraea sp. NPDC051941]|uniref:Uncharacterized protein n=1 Tax=Nonomuraea jabiensis TaxID=882448 RepID=A0A7W9LIV8_9ACTN|nr:hypothetical protein [Nonomuraea jabiensis]MBB5785354.1 hypothetical protein [Nonomuraea jabiensis]
MNRLFGKVSDFMLGLVVPRAEAAAYAPPPEWIGCCDFQICKFRSGSGVIACAQCLDPRCR